MQIYKQCIYKYMLNFELAWSFFELSALASTVTLALFSPNFTAALELFMWPDDVALPEFGPWTVPTFPRTAAGAGKAGALMLLLTWAAFGTPCFKKLSVVNMSFFHMATCLSRSLSCYRMSTNTACFGSLPNSHTAHYYGRYTHYIRSTQKNKKKSLRSKASSMSPQWLPVSSSDTSNKVPYKQAQRVLVQGEGSLWLQNQSDLQNRLW